MTRHRLMLLAFAFVGVLLGTWMMQKGLFDPPLKYNQAVTQEAYDRIRVGMSTKEVEDILGSDFFAFDDAGVGQLGCVFQDMGSGQMGWKGPEIDIWVTYAMFGRRVLEKRIVEHSPRAPDTFPMRLRRALAY